MTFDMFNCRSNNHGGILHWPVGHYRDSSDLSACRNTTNVARCGADTDTVVIAIKIDGFVKSREISLFVIPAEAGIQLYQIFTACLDSSRARSGIYRSDGFLRVHQDDGKSNNQDTDLRHHTG